MKHPLPHIYKVLNQIVFEGGFPFAYTNKEPIEGVVKLDCCCQAAVNNPVNISHFNQDFVEIFVLLQEQYNILPGELFYNVTVTEGVLDQPDDLLTVGGVCQVFPNCVLQLGPEIIILYPRQFSWLVFCKEGGPPRPNPPPWGHSNPLIKGLE